MDRRRSTRLSGENAVNGLAAEETRGEGDAAVASGSGTSGIGETAVEPVKKKQKTAGGVNVRRREDKRRGGTNNVCVPQVLKAPTRKGKARKSILDTSHV